MNKDLKYIVIILVLLVVNLGLFFGGKPTPAEGKAYFALRDTSEVMSVKIKGGESEVALERSTNGWKVNGQYPADPRFTDILLTLIQRVKVKRVIGTWEEPTDGSVEINTAQNTFSFDFASDANRTKTYFVKEGIGEEVEVPGYRDNVSDLFLLHADQWRDRLIFDGSWRTIQALKLSQDGKEPVEIKFDKSFYQVNGSSAIDSTKVVDYLNQFQFFEANEMISDGRFPALDSLGKTKPLAQLVISDIKNPQPTQITIYPNLEGANFHLATTAVNQLKMVIDTERVANILQSADYFLVDSSQ